MAVEGNTNSTSTQVKKDCLVYGYSLPIGTQLLILLRGRQWVMMRCVIMDCTMRAIVCRDLDTNRLTLVPISEIKTLQILEGDNV